MNKEDVIIDIYKNSSPYVGIRMTHYPSGSVVESKEKIHASKERKVREELYNELKAKVERSQLAKKIIEQGKSF